MSAPSLRVILGAGLIVLAAQLVVWLTPARYLFVSSADNPPALGTGGKDRAGVPSARRLADDSKSGEVPAKEPPTAAGERVAQAPLLQEGEAGATGKEAAPVIPDSEANGDISPPKAEETPAPTDSTTAENLASPEAEAKSETSPPQAEQTPALTDSTVAENLASLEPEAKSDTSPPQADETQVPTDSTTAENSASPEQEAKSDTGEPDTEETPSPAEDAVAENLASLEPEATSDPSPAGAEEATGPADGATVENGATPQVETKRETRSPQADDTPSPAKDAVASATDEPSFLEAIRSKLDEPVLRKGSHPDDLAALDEFYANREGAARWFTAAGLTPQAQTIVTEIAKADDWGLDSSTFVVPPPDFQTPVTENQAATEAAIDIAILKYARAAQGGRTKPSAISKVFTQKPSLREPSIILAEIHASPTPNAYLRDLHPKHEQFERLRQALIKMRTEGEAKEDQVKKLQANMERWRWMPSDLGTTHVWLNIPEFMVSVIKNGKTVDGQKAVVGSSKSPTPSLSANLTSIEFNPYRVVPTSVVRRKILPALKKDRSWLGRGKTSVLEQYQLEVKHKGKTVDPTKINWEKVNVANLTFVQAPSPKNPMSKVQFRFPNPRDIDLRATINSSELKRAVRSVGPSSPRVGQADKLAGALLAQDKGWKAPRIAKLIADGKNTSVKLGRPIPVHITYFTAIADDQGNVEDVADVYGLDEAVEAAIQGSEENKPTTAEPVPLPSRSPKAEEGLATRSP